MFSSHIFRTLCSIPQIRSSSTHTINTCFRRTTTAIPSTMRSILFIPNRSFCSSLPTSPDGTSTTERKTETNQLSTEEYSFKLKTAEPAYFAAFTCKQCDHRQGHSFSKQSYHNGVVIARCPGCKGLHLIADNLKWFSSEKRTAEAIARAVGESVITLTKETSEYIAENPTNAESLLHYGTKGKDSCCGHDHSHHHKTPEPQQDGKGDKA
jgi:protein import protein ZIM17